MPALSLSCFGPPRIELDGQPVRIANQKALALLVYLAVTGTTQRRDSLATLFWPDRDRRRARTYLRQALYALTKTLGDHPFETSRETIGLNLDAALHVDVLHFQSQCAETCEENKLAHADVLQLEAAVARYQDDFLAGFTLPDCPQFDQWCRVQAESLRRQLAEVLQTLVEWHAAHHAYDEAIAHARHWLALDPLHEAAHRALMRLYAQLGERAAAMHQYEHCVARLDDELGIAPDAKTKSLYADIRTGHLSPAEEPKAVDVGNRETRKVDYASPDRTADRVHNHPPSAPGLPHPLTDLIGRADEVARVIDALTHDTARLLTLVGPPGVGKTRLALEVAWQPPKQFVGAVTFISLAPIEHPTNVPEFVLSGLGVEDVYGQSPLESLVQALQDRPMLLILDNFEHLLDAAPFVSALLAECPRLKVLTTSRETLNIHGEHLFPIHPLRLPPRDARSDLDAITRSPAVQLFAHRARAARPKFELTDKNVSDVVEICTHLDGLPLAIELAAARLRLFTLGELNEQLVNRFQVLRTGRRDAEKHHATLEDAIAWSYDLLPAAEQQLFRCLGVFSGGWTLESAAAVCGSHVHCAMDMLDGIASLVDKSLVHRVGGETLSDGQARFTMLETLRAYAVHQLRENDEEAAVRRRHLDYCVALAEAGAPDQEAAVLAEWLDCLESEHDNLLSALNWSLSDSRQSQLAFRFAANLVPFWRMRNYHSLGREQLTCVLANTPDNATSERASVLIGAADLAVQDAFDLTVAKKLYAEGYEVYNQSGDAMGLASALEGLAEIADLQEDQQQWRILVEKQLALYRQLEDERGIARTLCRLARGIFRREADREGAQALAEESLSLYKRLDEPTGVIEVTEALGLLTTHAENYPVARKHLETCLSLSQRLGDQLGQSGALYRLGRVAYYEGKYAEARRLLEESLTLYRTAMEDKDTPWSMLLQVVLALATLRLGQIDEADALVRAALNLLLSMPSPQLFAPVAGYALYVLAYVITEQRDLTQATRLLSAAGSILDAVTHEPLHPVHRAERDAVHIHLRAELGDKAFEQAWAEGQELTLDECLTGSGINSVVC